MSIDEGHLQTHFELAVVPDVFHLYYSRPLQWQTILLNLFKGFLKRLSLVLEVTYKTSRRAFEGRLVSSKVIKGQRLIQRKLLELMILPPKCKHNKIVLATRPAPILP